MRLVSAVPFEETLSPYSRSFVPSRRRHRIAPKLFYIPELRRHIAWFSMPAVLYDWIPKVPGLVFLSLKAKFSLVLPLPLHPTMFLLSYSLGSVVDLCINI